MKKAKILYELSKVFILQDDYETKCLKYGIEQSIIDYPISKIPRKVLLKSIQGYDFHVFECPNCKQKSIQFFDMIGL
jgi:hypothetical protein